MLHPIYIGRFDHDELRLGKFVVQQPLDMELVALKLRQTAELAADGFYHIHDDRFLAEDGFLYCLDSVRSQEAAELIAEIATETNAEIVFWSSLTAVTPSQYLEHFTEISKIRRTMREQARAARKGKGAGENTAEKTS